GMALTAQGTALGGTPSGGEPGGGPRGGPGHGGGGGAPPPPPARGVAPGTPPQGASPGDMDHGGRGPPGAFQPRPAQGWGTPAQIMNPAYAATTFYQHLVQVPDWQHIPLTEAAQAVQRSAFPNAYARWEPLADALVQALVRALPSTGVISDANIRTAVEF